MIDAINLLLLRNSEFIQYCKNFISVVGRRNPSALSVQPKYDAMVLKIAEMEGLFKTAVANPMTSEMEALDFRRDQAVNGIIANINSYSYHFDETLRDAAEVLQNNLKLYGAGIAKENYQSETAIINNLVSDWQDKPELSAALDTLGLNVWIAELKSVNEDFDKKFLDRTHDYGSASPANMKSKRAEAMAAYYDLRDRLNAYAVIEGTELYAITISELNALIEQYNSLLKGRAKSKKTADKDTAQVQIDNQN